MGHKTRTMVFDNDGRMYVSVGSVGNVDGDSYRSRIRRFPGLADGSPQVFPIDFSEGEVFADGLRNEVGLAWSSPSRKMLYGVENGMDNLYRADLGGDIHTDNPENMEHIEALQPLDDESDDEFGPGPDSHRHDTLIVAGDIAASPDNVGRVAELAADFLASGRVSPLG